MTKDWELFEEIDVSHISIKEINTIIDGFNEDDCILKTWVVKLETIIGNDHKSIMIYRRQYYTSWYSTAAINKADRLNFESTCYAENLRDAIWDNVDEVALYEESDN